MNLSYEHIKKKQEQSGNHWTSNSDLFMVLSFLFLLLYVVASFRTGVVNYVAHAKVANADQKLKVLEQQMSIYEKTTNATLQKGAVSDQRQQVFKELMQKIDLLKEQSRHEQQKLAGLLDDEKVKSKELNAYQMTIKNLISANIRYTAKLEERDRQLRDKQLELEANRNQIVRHKEELEDRTKSFNKKEIEWFKQRDKHLGEIEELRVSAKQKDLKLSKTQSEIDAIKQKIDRRNRVNSELLQKIKDLDQSYQAKIGRIDSSNKKILQREKKLYEKDRAKLKKQLDDQKNHGKWLQKELQNKNSELKSTKRMLAKAQEKALMRRHIANLLTKRMANNAVNAQIDQKSSDLIIDFGDEYFDTDRYYLKPGMKRILREIIPIYAKTLFETQRIAKSIDDIEIIGFASPTYNERIVDPTTLAPSDRIAVNYNLNLSYNRARSIFGYLFELYDSKVIKSSYLKSMLPLVTIAGQSFFREDIKAKNPEKLDFEKFCKEYNCKKSQKVVIRFKMKD